MRIHGCVLALSCALWLGCGDDDGVVFSSGLPPDQQLSDSSPDELAMACVAFRDALDASLGSELTRVNCVLAALPDSVSVTLSGELHGDVAQCQQLVDQCQVGSDAAMPSATRNVPAGASTNTITRGLRELNCSTPAATAAERTCDATVAEYESCRNATLDELEVLVAGISCEQTIARIERTQQLNQAQPRMETPPQCDALLQQCPQVTVPATHPVE
jgi:hypothetical protein